jgi:glycosyltransferase involved in cell wall biosynthesis
MAMALKKIGYYAVIASPKANNKLIGEYVEQGLSFIIRPSLPYVKKEDLKWVDDFDVVFTNVIQMIQCACEISCIKPTVWWLHESSDEYSPIYHNTLFRFQHYAYMTCFEKVNIFAVSNIARNNFNKYFPNAKVGILTYGIPDKTGEATIDEEKDNIVFAVIGSMERVKAQDIFVEAADKLNCAVAKFWIIGKNHYDDYCQKVCSMADKNSSIRILGEMTRKQMDELYRKIDVVVCSSRDETMSITTTEGMMYGKTCIVTKRAGMAEYVDDGKNGFTFESGNSDDLCAKMKWCVENRNQLNVIGQNARKTYEEFFTIEKFGERLESIIENL